jgi:uncharacterized membrane protein
MTTLSLLVSVLWPWLLASAALGLLVGLRLHSGVRRWVDGAALWTLLLLVLGMAAIALAVWGGLGGRSGLWVEIIALVFAVYLAGNTMGYALERTVTKNRRVPAADAPPGRPESNLASCPRPSRLRRNQSPLSRTPCPMT